MRSRALIKAFEDAESLRATTPITFDVNSINLISVNQSLDAALIAIQASLLQVLLQPFSGRQQQSKPSSPRRSR